MTANTPINLWTSTDHAHQYLERADALSHRGEADSALLEFIPNTARRILDLGTGDGRLLALLKLALLREGVHETEAIALDFSPAMIDAARKRFAGDSSVSVVTHNLDRRLPALGKFNAVISSIAIPHLVPQRTRELYTEVHGLLNPGGVFCNLKHVAAPTEAQHESL